MFESLRAHQERNNMQYYISYFGQMKNFPSNVLPVSTVKWEQEWFRGKIPHIDELVMPDNLVYQIEQKGEMCRKNCPLKAPCLFMLEFRKYLDTLNFEQLITKLELLTIDKPYIDTIILMVYEKTDVPCAERPVLQAWFKDNGLELKEWTKPSKEKSLF